MEGAQTQFIFELIYLQCITTMKISILLFYRQLFDTKRYRIVLLILGCFVVSYDIAFTMVTVFQCMPIHYMWTRVGHGFCLDTSHILLAGSLLNIFTNVIIVILPIPIVWMLQVSRRQKMGLTALFLLGSL